VSARLRGRGCRRSIDTYRSRQRGSCCDGAVKRAVGCSFQGERGLTLAGLVSFRVTAEAFVRRVELPAPMADEQRRAGYPWQLPVVAALAAPLVLDPKVTYLIGENGTGKSTLVEAIAVAAGMNPEGGSRNFSYATRSSHSELSQAIRLVRGARRPKTEFFLRAESLFTAATYIENLDPDQSLALAPYGGRSLHEQSHGESFLAVMLNRFGPNGFYVLDEPEAALSTQNCLTLLRRIHELVAAGSQFIVATHSPLVLAYPHAVIYSCNEHGFERVEYDDSEPVRLTKSFLDARQRFLEELLAD
jgi:predicted ATPase